MTLIWTNVQRNVMLSYWIGNFKKTCQEKDAELRQKDENEHRKYFSHEEAVTLERCGST